MSVEVDGLPELEGLRRRMLARYGAWAVKHWEAKQGTHGRKGWSRRYRAALERGLQEVLNGVLHEAFEQVVSERPAGGAVAVSRAGTPSRVLKSTDEQRATAAARATNERLLAAGGMTLDALTSFQQRCFADGMSLKEYVAALEQLEDRLDPRRHVPGLTADEVDQVLDDNPGATVAMVAAAAENVRVGELFGNADYYDANTVRGYAPGNGWGELVKSSSPVSTRVNAGPTGQVVNMGPRASRDWQPAPWPADLAPPGAEDVERRASYLDEDRYQ